MALKQIICYFEFSQSSCHSPFGSNNPSKIKILKISEKVSSLSPEAYEWDLMVFNQYCLDYFAKVRSQADLYGRNAASPPMHGYGEGANLL